MPSSRLESAINKQIVNELWASNSYLMIASYMDEQGLKVLAKRFFEQSDEERMHALKLLNYLLSTGCAPLIDSIPATKRNFDSIEAAVQSALDQEKTVTDQINELMGIAQDEKDYASVSFLRWFVDEQVEEVATMSDLLLLIKRAGPANLLLVEERLQRGAAPGSSPVE